MSRRLLTLAALSPLFLSGLARADRELMLPEALELAQKGNYDLKAQKARLDQAKAGVEQAWTALLPQVAAQGKYTHNYKEVTLDYSAFNAGTIGLADAISAAAPAAIQTQITNFENQLKAATPGAAVIQKQEQLDGSLAATVPLIVPWAYSGVSSSKRTFEAAKATYDLSETTVLYSVAQAFYAAAGNDELVVARKDAITVAQKTVDNTRSRLAAGVVNKVEVMRAELALVRAEQALKEALDNQAQAYRSLGTLIQLHEPFHVQSTQDVMPAAVNQPDRVINALKLRPEFRADDLTVRAAKAQRDSAAWRWAPTLSAFGNLRGFNYAGFSGDKYAWAVGLQLDWLIYDGGVRDAQRHLNAAQERESEAHLLLLRDTIADEIANADRAYGTKRYAVDTAQRSLDLSRQTLELVRVQYDAGTATQLDLLTAQDNLVGSEVTLAQAHFDFLLGGLTLDRVSGTFPPPPSKGDR